ncbi:hypothetical protein [Aliivibrio fischeri]|uniref:hypothetical protein n=1 Tax=Aliivibrio fischeri TaxID=668 RepID=UPI0007C5203A|nr:hypothetical protein [Aliivibrio fischeri]MCE7555259.1 hypothetical protein [Aliivibrio fischeri]MCE7562527.1 hypothetical protein [Aliivibrio fischeri]MCE7565967.1 hypothetical protein [Aliivibrio fischeri]MCE7569935.1 hypothetical protein [Aliivibrio fischeri]TDM51973.1 hypothetical protein VFFQA001_17885 [Aliivibrio fischeri]
MRLKKLKTQIALKKEVSDRISNIRIKLFNAVVNSNSKKDKRLVEELIAEYKNEVLIYESIQIK